MTAVRSLALVVLSLLALSAHAGDRGMPSGVPEVYAKECGACHVAYAPGALPADSWRRIVVGLDRHYGTDASLDPAVWRHDGVKSAANCGACHVGADRGHFDDDELRIPPGLPARHRGAWSD